MGYERRYGRTSNRHDAKHRRTALARKARVQLNHFRWQSPEGMFAQWLAGCGRSRQEHMAGKPWLWGATTQQVIDAFLKLAAIKQKAIEKRRRAPLDKSIAAR